MPQPPSASTNLVYNDGALQIGCFFATIKRSASVSNNARASASTIGVYYFETFNIQRPLKKVTQQDEIGGPNGFAMVTDFNTASFTFQAGPSTNNPVLPGDWIEITQNATIGVERWILQVDQPFEQNGYYKYTGTAHKATYIS